MGSSKIIATRKRQVFMSHICSNCNFPVITIVEVEAEASKSYSFLQSKAEKIASETAEKAIEYEISKIEKCRNTKLPLVSKDNKDNTISFGHYCESSITGFEASCPNCTNIEPWQTTSNFLLNLVKNEMSKLDDDNFPIVFKDSEKAEQWACNHIYNILEIIKQKRNVEDNIENAKNELAKSIDKIQQWENELNTIPEIIEMDNIKNKYNNLQEIKDQLSIFDIKKKNEINLNIKSLELRTQDINEILAKKSGPLISKIQNERVNLLNHQAIAYGYKDNIICKTRENSYCFLFEPNSIPKEKSEVPIVEKENNSQKNISKEKLTNNFKIITYCRKCGFKLLPESAYCSKCGFKID